MLRNWPEHCRVCLLSSRVCQSCGRKIFNVVELFRSIHSGLERNVEVPLCSSHQDMQVSIKRLIPSSVCSPDRRIYTKAVLPLRNHQISQNRLKENMLLDVNQEIITPRVPHFSAELNVENLCGKQTTQLKVLIANPNGRIDSHCSFDDKTKSIIVKACRHKWTKV